MNTARTHVQHGFSQFTLTQNLLNNLSQFKLTPTAKLVLLELSSFYNPKKVDMFPKQKTLAKKIGISERSVVRAIQELLNEGLIIIECKYTNHYKFTSKIISQQPENKNFYNENMSEDFGQNSSQLSDNLAEHEYEPTKEPIKEPTGISKGGNVYSFQSNDSILEDYAIKHGARNVKAYINTLKSSGSAAKIISEYKKQKKVTQIALSSIQETQELLAEYRQKHNGSPYECEAWLKVGAKIAHLQKS